jgi:hypothetical protein
VIVVAVERRGVTPLPVTTLGVTVPDHKIAAAPPPVLHVEKCDTVPVPPVPAGKSMLATGDTDPPVTAQPPEDRATFTAAYDV